jgi:hypothetical protein
MPLPAQTVDYKSLKDRVVIVGGSGQGSADMQTYKHPDGCGAYFRDPGATSSKC